jgi:hypothetical protein
VSRAEYGVIVLVEVGFGDNMRIFHVFKGLLTHFSTYFKTALKDTWIEGATNKVKLADDNPEVFSAVYTWLFSGKLYFDLAADGSIPMTEQLICEIYVFGDARGSPDLCNAAIDLLFQKSVQLWRFFHDSLHYVWQNSLKNAPMRRYLIDSACENFGWDPQADDVSLYPVEFLLRVTRVSRKAQGIAGSLYSDKDVWCSKKKRMSCAISIMIIRQ